MIAKTIEKNIIATTSKNYENFLKNHLQNMEKPTVISFNWELLADNVLFAQNSMDHFSDVYSVDYGADFIRIDERGIRQNNRVALYSLLKLHGSLNWMHCPKCVHNNLFFVYGGKPAIPILEGELIQCPKCKRCLKSVIVPPSFQKIGEGNELSFLSYIWAKAKSSLINADKIIIIGYSFPDDDVHFKHFLRGALVSNYRKNKNKGIKIEVVNFKMYSQDKIDFEKHYKDILSIPGVKIEVNFLYQKFSEYAKGNH